MKYLANKIVLNTCLVLVLLSCNMREKNKIEQINPMLLDKQGHRGCRGLLPENTVPAFLKAIELNVNTLEMDVVVTKDSQVILSHEPIFNHEISRKPDGADVTEAEENSLNIFQMTYDSVKKYDVGLKPHPRFEKQQKIAAYKPLLSEVIDTAESFIRSKSLPLLQYNIEIKSKKETDGICHPQVADFVELVMTVIKNKSIEDRVIIQSFDIRALQYMHEHYPSIKTAYLLEEPVAYQLKENIEKLGFIPSIYSPNYKVVNDSLVAACHRLQLKIIPWTVNDLESMKKFKNMGVDGIISDYPDLFVQLP